MLLVETRLERDLPSYLPPSRKRLGGYLAKVSSGQITLDVLEVWMVEQVVELKPELQIKPFRYVCVFVSGHICLHKGRIAESI